MQHFSADKTYALFLNPTNRKVISELEVIGAKTILFPALETREIASDESENLSNLLKKFDWLTFTDIYTVEFFLQKLEQEEFDFYELDEIRVCAYGESVADRLRFVQVHADIIPNSIKTTEVSQTIKDYFIDEDELKDAKFLVLKEKNANPAISKELENLNATVSELQIYEIIAESESETAKLKSLLIGGAIDEFIFTSPFDIINLANLFPTENLEDVLAETKLYASDKATDQSIQEFRIAG
jgi:uroporphyrinogen-III synthase